MHNVGVGTHSEASIREAFHVLFLERLFAISDPAQYALKGGVNLRLFFASPRYSEDLDLDVLAGAAATLRKNGFKIIEDKSFARALQAFGVAELRVNDPTKAKQTGTTQRFRVRLVTSAGIELPTKVEFSRRPAVDAYTVATETVPGERVRPYGRLGFRCPHYDGRSAALQKARALVGRETPQCRDVFDLRILALGGYATRSLFSASLSSEERAAGRAVVESLEHRDYVGQVVEFLEDDARSRFGDAAAWDEMRLAVLELLADG